MDQLIPFIIAYKYEILFPLAIIEGPLLAVVAGFLVSLGTLNMFIVYAIIVLGDVIGDSIFYLLGRSGHSFLAKHGHFIGATPERLATTREYFDNHHTKAITASKLIHGIGVTGLITAGSLKIPYRKFITTCMLVSFPQAAVLLVIGILFGHAYNQIGHYFSVFAEWGVIVGITVLVIFLIYRLTKRLPSA